MKVKNKFAVYAAVVAAFALGGFVGRSNRVVHAASPEIRALQFKVLRSHLSNGKEMREGYCKMAPMLPGATASFLDSVRRVCSASPEIEQAADEALTAIEESR